MEFTLLWAALTGIGAAFIGTKVWDERLPDRPMDRLMGAAVAGLLVGRLAAMVGQGINPITNPLDIIIVRGGVSTPAATLVAVAILIWPARRDPAVVDSLAPSALAGLAGWHAGCLWRGACLGTASDLPWAWSTPNSDIARHPVELYAAILLIAGAYAIARAGWRPFFRSGMALAVAGGARLLTEPMRPSISGGPIVWYATAIILGIGMALLGRRIQRSLLPAPT
jgi:prolipoprotein diacylglyceryltransferase